MTLVGRIPPLRGEGRHHRVEYVRQNGCRRVMVEVDHATQPSPASPKAPGLRSEHGAGSLAIIPSCFRAFAPIARTKFELVAGREVEMRMPLVEVWEKLQAEVERLAGEAGLQILRALLEDEVRQRVGPAYHPDPAQGARRWGSQPGCVVFGGQKIALDRRRTARSGEVLPARQGLPRTRRAGQEIESKLALAAGGLRCITREPPVSTKLGTCSVARLVWRHGSVCNRHGVVTGRGGRGHNEICHNLCVTSAGIGKRVTAPSAYSRAGPKACPAYCNSK